MIIHIVLFKPTEHADHTEVSAIIAGLAELTEQMDGATAFQAGSYLKPDPVSRGYSHGFTIVFRDSEALERYLTDPEHQQLGARLLAVTQGGIDGLLVVDLKSPI